MVIVIESDPFVHTKISPVTKKSYLFAMEQFKRHSGFAKEEDLSKVEPKVLKQKLVEYVIFLKGQGQSYSKQNIAISAIQKFYEVNDLEGINWAYIRGYTSENDTNGDDEPYTKEELRTLIASANPRTKAIILTMLSAGLRIGAVPLLKVKHLEKMEKQGLYKVTVYADSKKDRYVTFTTPEAARAIDDYLKTRTIKCENLKPDSPLFRQEFDVKDANIAKEIKPVKFSGLFNLIQDLAVNTGIRTLGRRTKASYNPRQDRPLTHSFRKIANSAFIKSGMKPVIAEKLLGHNIGLQAHYLRFSDEELLGEYLKSIDLLTVSQEKHLQKEVDKLQSEVADVGAMKRAYLALKAENERQRQKNALLEDVVLAGNKSERQAAVARLREFHGLESADKPYPTRDLELLDRVGGIRITDRSREVRKESNTSFTRSLGAFINPETGEKRYFINTGVPEGEGVEKVEFRGRKKKKKKKKRKKMEEVQQRRSRTQ